MIRIQVSISPTCLSAAFTRPDPESAKRQSNFQCLFAFLGSARVNALIMTIGWDTPRLPGDEAKTKFEQKSPTKISTNIHQDSPTKSQSSVEQKSPEKSLRVVDQKTPTPNVSPVKSSEKIWSFKEELEQKLSQQQKRSPHRVAPRSQFHKHFTSTFLFLSYSKLYVLRAIKIYVTLFALILMDNFLSDNCFEI